MWYSAGRRQLLVRLSDGSGFLTLRFFYFSPRSARAWRAARGCAASARCGAARSGSRWCIPNTAASLRSASPPLARRSRRFTRRPRACRRDGCARWSSRRCATLDAHGSRPTYPAERLLPAGTADAAGGAPYRASPAASARARGAGRRPPPGAAAAGLRGAARPPPVAARCCERATEERARSSPRRCGRPRTPPAGALALHAHRARRRARSPRSTADLTLPAPDGAAGAGRCRLRQDRGRRRRGGARRGQRAGRWR